jgi:hypothetical protein
MKPITFVLISCGELTEERCLKAIQPFREEIEFIEIRNEHPQVVALNKMIAAVKTDYFIELDADMILYEDAWPRIMNAWRKHHRNLDWHSLLFNLWDTLTERKILSLKLMRTAVMKANPFAEGNTPDVEHYHRLTVQGYTCIHDYLKLRPIGEHVVTGRHFCYFKYRDLYQTYRFHNFEWDSGAFLGGSDLRERAKAHFDFFVRKWTTSGNDDYLDCIAGMMDGILSPLEPISKNLSREATIKREEGVDRFMDWYLADLIPYAMGSVF